MAEGELPDELEEQESTSTEDEDLPASEGAVVPINKGERSPYMVRRAIKTYGEKLTDPKYASFAKLLSEGKSQIEAFLAINPHAEEWERRHAIAQASCLAAHPNIVEWRVAHALGAQDQLKALVPACIKVLSEIINGGHNANAKVQLDALKTALSRGGLPESKELAITGVTMSLHALARLEELRAPGGPLAPAGAAISQERDDEADVIELPWDAWRTTLPPPDGDGHRLTVSTRATTDRGVVPDFGGTGVGH